MLTERVTDSANYLKSLNPRQLEAVEALDGPVLVLAGAGTGKTKALTTRIAHILLQRKAYPSQVLAVTFTNKAAREMVRRITDLVGEGVEGMWIGTFHSIAAKILRRHAEVVGLRPDFTILDADDQLRLLKQLISAADIDDKKFPPRVFMAIIGGWKDKGLMPDNLSRAKNTEYCFGKVTRIYAEYQARLKSLNACDFGDLLMHNLNIFKAHGDILEKYAQKFRYILVDEYQDTNTAQYVWLRMLAAAHKNICCVGDDDQSIYGWRGADVGNILKFEQDYPGAKVIKLEQNYRSTAPILGAASGLIARNGGRLGKTLWTESEGGEKIKILSLWDDREEARLVTNHTNRLRLDEHLSLKEIAVLVRAGFQTRAFEERFVAEGIPYRVIGGLRFYERQEIRDVIAYLRMIANHDDDLAFERIVNVPKRGLGDTTIDNVRRFARENGYSLFGAAKKLAENDGLKAKAKYAMQGLVNSIERWSALLETLSHTDVVNTVIEESGYREMWKLDSSPDAAGRLENVKELVTAISEFTSLAAFLEHVSLVADTDNISDDNMVNIMTLHAAKGLEFEAVFLPGWEEGLFPHQRSLDENGVEGLEEERRLAYVGITRARKFLFISHVSNRRIFNQWQTCVPSRFIAEIPGECTEKVASSGGSGYSGGSLQDEVKRIMAAAYNDSDEDDDGTSFAESGAKEGKFYSGSRVFHDKFGYGWVRSASGDKIEVSFDKAGVKKVMGDYLNKA